MIQKNLKSKKKFIQHTARNCNVFVIHNENIKIDIEDVLFLKPPIVFKELVNQLYKIIEKGENLSNVVRLKYFHLNLKKNQLIFNKTNKILKLTELEGEVFKIFIRKCKRFYKTRIIIKSLGT